MVFALLARLVNMVNLRTLTSLTYLAQVASLGGNAQTHSSQLRDIVPRREVLYVGGRYTNITASLVSHKVYAYLRLENRTM
jgi:hypothetical protein